MNFQERKKEILKLLEERSSVTVELLGQLLHTSAITIRRDLASLAENGLIYRTHGGAMKINDSTETVGFTNKTVVNASAKEYICRNAAKYIKDGDTIFLDCGSTVSRICPFIRYRKIKVITNSLPVLHELVNSSATLTLIGGTVDKERRAIHGMIALEQIARYKCDKAFIGVDGISLAKGLSANSEKEAGITKAIAANADEIFLLCDSGKLEKDKYFQFASLSMINYLVTDDDADGKLLLKYKKKGITIIS
jgi:DeoR family transcriptional regulator, fructose operon transcriptional repressor